LGFSDDELTPRSKSSPQPAGTRPDGDGQTDIIIKHRLHQARMIPYHPLQCQFPAQEFRRRWREQTERVVEAPATSRTQCGQHSPRWRSEGLSASRGHGSVVFYDYDEIEYIA
jgi:isocitrate dehydrogenase kinase/phosphatase